MELRPDLTCLWKLLGDACTAVRTVSPNRARVVVPAPLAVLVSNTQSQILNQAQALQAGERYEQKLSTSTNVSDYIFNIVIFITSVQFELRNGWKSTTVSIFCVQMLCSGLEAEVWSPQSMARSGTQLLPPVMPALCLRGRSECHMCFGRKGPGGEMESPTWLCALCLLLEVHLFVFLPSVFKKGCYVGQWKS